MGQLTQKEARVFANETWSIVMTRIDRLLKRIDTADRTALVKHLEGMTDEFIAQVIEEIGVES